MMSPLREMGEPARFFWTSLSVACSVLSNGVTDEQCFPSIESPKSSLGKAVNGD